jgi:putative transposase
MKKYQKRTRLKTFDYKGTYRYSVTICTDYKKPFFKNNDTVTICISTLKTMCAKDGFIVLAYCFMPDHLHLLIEGINESSDFKRFISEFKQRTGYWFKQNLKKKLWQQSYFEHVLRDEESIKNLIKYIFMNPVRKGLVESYNDYSFLGSFEFDMDSLIF